MFVPTKSAQFRQSIPYEEVVYESYKKGSKEKRKATRGTEEPEKNKDDEVTMKKLRLDVMKFAATGFSRRKKKMTKEAILVELGAKPAKKKYHNYKDLKEMRQRRVQEIKNRDELLEKCKQPALTKQISRKTNAKNASKKATNNANKNASKKHKDDNILGKWGSVKK